ncbi:uncharacterized protein PAC_11753 [Phialocephala subalpina]|uniref:Uncharacterized protein n=1 Tax=Phialocephala subalpina TaxID=576137 RepID=A0A1L7XA44_9HELO|nr:uncharacterized protein PAC_11753 [Phialocephala subalpina]
MCLVQIEKFYPRCGHSKACRQEEVQPDCTRKKLAFKMVTDDGPCNRCAVRAAEDASSSTPESVESTQESAEPKLLENKDAKRMWKIRYSKFEKWLKACQTTISRTLRHKTFRIGQSRVVSPALRIVPRNHIRTAFVVTAAEDQELLGMRPVVEVDTGIMAEIRALGRTIRKGLVVPGMAGIGSPRHHCTWDFDASIFVLELILAEAVLVENIH